MNLQGIDLDMAKALGCLLVLLIFTAYCFVQALRSSDEDINQGYEDLKRIEELRSPAPHDRGEA